MDALGETELWYRQYAASVHRRCRRLLGDDVLARDATQEVFLRAHQHAATLRRADSPLSWLLTVADRRCFSLMRHQRVVASAQVLLLAPSALPDSDDALEQLLVGADLVRRVRARCPEDVQHVAVRRYLDELEQEEIARELSISRKTVQRRLQAFHDAARKLLTSPSTPSTKGRLFG